MIFDYIYYLLFNPKRNSNILISRILKGNWIYIGIKRSSFRKAYNIRSKKKIVDTDNNADKYNFLYIWLVSQIDQSAPSIKQAGQSGLKRA